MKKTFANDLLPSQPAVLTAWPVGKSASPQNLRRLEWDELVRSGDFVEDGNQGFEPWEGPTGFRADAFVKAIYRQRAAPRPASESRKPSRRAPRNTVPAT